MTTLTRLLEWLAPRTAPDPARYQPRPLHVLAATVTVGGKSATALTRVWHPGDVPLCRLCNQCTAAGGACLGVTFRDVPGHELPLLAVHDPAAVPNGKASRD
jgi:hypothetical protein